MRREKFKKNNQNKMRLTSQHIDYSASLLFLRCPVHLTGNWVTERSSQYLIHLVKFTNIQPHNNIKNKNKKK